MSQPTPSLFREEALRHYLQAEEGRGLVKISPPWTWTLLWVLLSALGTALAASFLGHVEVNGRGRGIIRPSTGIRMLVSQSAGTVESIAVRSSQAVKAGAVLLRIASPGIQGQLLEAERQAESVRGEYRTLSQLQDAAYWEQSQRLRGRIAQIQGQLASHGASVQIYERRLRAKQALLAQGLVSAIETDEAREALEQTRRQSSGAQQALDQARQERAALEGRRQDELWQRRQVVQNSDIKRDTLALVQGQTLVRAPEEGVVEALLVKPGEVVQAGQVVGKLIPQGAPLQVVSFLAEKDRAFVKAGDEVHLELEQLPYAEFGTLRARVTRVSDDLASPFEIREALGDDQRPDTPTYRVELAITDARALDAAKVKLRTGMLMNVRYTLRRQRLITLVLDPLRRWFR
jgi:membrane fusion protein